MDIYELRRNYPEFIYKKYEIIDENEKIILKFLFEIKGLVEFNPSIEINKKDFKFKNINSNVAKNIVFNLGMIEAISYFKATCSPKFIVECGNLDNNQIEWFEKLIYLGLGELRFVNNINISKDEFVKIESYGKKLELEKIDNNNEGILIPVGGGKDSNVTMDLLKDYKLSSNPVYIGTKNVPIECAMIAGYKRNEIVEVRRNIDRNIIELNKKGFINGHTPFSAIVAFTTYFISFIMEKKYIALSNEDSANETNVKDKNINHQYSKTIEFENDFRVYANKYLKQNIEYFSMLRPINELQIGMLFSELDKYHKIFKSCNQGSKKAEWIWCNNCPKCLFVYIILSPFLYKDKLIDIFGEDLFEKEELLETFIELCGYGNVKPFECVGTFSEVNYAITKTIKNQEGKKLPYLLNYYKENYKLDDLKEDKLHYFNEINNVPNEFINLLKERIFEK
ncbi:MAG: hypothetical protein ACI4UE_04010 [Candidatus Scatovivens sp.]